MVRRPKTLLSVGVLILCAVMFAPAAAQAATCSDYPNQAAAQRAADTLDANGDGIFCNALPCPCLKPGQSSGGQSTPPPPPAPQTSTVSCGKERQTVKTLQDSGASRVNFNPVTSTVERLRRMAPPGVGTHSPRLPGEFRTYRLRVRLRSFKFEDDSDIHLVVASPTDATKTMIVELPNPGCNRHAGATRRRRMAAARSALLSACGRPKDARFRLLTGTATITGVAFFDILHGQRGVAPNGIELHPLLSFRSTSRCTSR